jgi:hypothetical protein
LAPRIVIPGHGPAFTTVLQSIADARARLDSFVSNPARHTAYAAKVLLKFKLLEAQSMPLSALYAWTKATPYFSMIFERQVPESDFLAWIDHLIGELVRTGAAARNGEWIRNAG